MEPIVYVLAAPIAAADPAWRYVTYLTVGYTISRGLAKPGSRNPGAEGE
jgi:hypothetical protein